MPPIRETGNRLLAGLSPAMLLGLNLERVELPISTSLSEVGVLISHAYFLDSGIASFVLGRDTTDGVESGVVGRDGLVGGSLLLGVDQTPHRVFMQIGGRGWRVASADLLRMTAAHADLQSLLLRYVHCFMVQVSATAYANARFTTEERLARWLLLCVDRTGTNDLELTHEFLSVMLGVRRPSVTVATHILEGKGMIRAKRAMISVLDRSMLEDFAGDAYGIAEAEYDRLFEAAAPTA